MAGPNTFAGEALDRTGPRRTDEAWLAARLADPATRVVAAGEAGVLVAGGRLRLSRSTSCPRALELVLLGVDGDGRAVFAADPATRSPASARGLRDVAAVLSHAEGGMLAHAVGAARTGIAATASARTAARRPRRARPGTCARARSAARSTTRAPTRW